MSNVNKIVFILQGKSNKQLDEDARQIKAIIKNNHKVVLGPVCFKGQRQITGYIQFSSTLDRLMKFNPHKSVKVRII